MNTPDGCPCVGIHGLSKFEFAIGDEQNASMSASDVSFNWVALIICASNKSCHDANQAFQVHVDNVDMEQILHRYADTGMVRLVMLSVVLCNHGVQDSNAQSQCCIPCHQS